MEDFGHLLLSHPMKLKAFLMDQTIIAGIGNIYSDEILFTAGLRYDRMSDSLSTQEMRRLCRGRWSRRCTRPSSTAARRSPTSSTSTSTARRASTRSTTRSTTARRSRAAGAAPPIVKTKFAGRTTYYCEQCQV